MSSSSIHQNNEIKSQTKKILAIDTLRGYAIDSENWEYKNLSKIDGFSNGENILENHDRYFKYINGSLEKRYDCIVICCSDLNLALEKEIETLCKKIFPTSKIYIIGSRAPLFTHWFSKLNNKPNFGELIAVSRIKYLDPNKAGMVCGLFTRSKSDKEEDDEILVQIDGINIPTNDFKDLDVLIKNKMPTYSPTNPNVNIIYVAVYPEGYQFKDQKLVSKNFSHKDTDRAKGALLFGKNKMNENVQNYIEIKEHQDANVKVMKAAKKSQLSSSVKSSTKLVNIQNVNNELQQQHRQQLKHFFAIDIGTTSCRAALIYIDKNGKEQCEKVNLKGENEKMPSIVNFCENQTYKGCEAEENYANSSDAKINSENTVYDITHFLGKNINEISENQFRHFQVEENRDFIKIKIPNGLILPEVACGELLKYIAQEADAKLKAETKSIVTHVTLTTPILNDEMKIKYETALKCAAQLASLKVIEFIDAPTAVLIDYIFTYKKLTTVNFNICVIDIGGGTTDIVAYNVESDGQEFSLKTLFKYENSKFNGRNFDIAFAEKIQSII
uniref:Uncharacterized protein n=1 Tax=Panagrolaimus sp. PS1159 TaxID=55785 RepID=A0AC35FL53_9BILA